MSWLIQRPKHRQLSFHDLNVLQKYACTYSPHRLAGVCKRRFVVSAWKGGSWSHAGYFSLAVFFDLAADSHFQLLPVITHWSHIWSYSSIKWLMPVLHIEVLYFTLLISDKWMEKLWSSGKHSVSLGLLLPSPFSITIFCQWVDYQPNRATEKCVWYCQRSSVISTTITPISWHLDGFQRITVANDSLVNWQPTN